MTAERPVASTLSPEGSHPIMSRVSDLQESLLKDPAYAHEFAKLNEEVGRLKTLLQESAAGQGRRKRPAAAPPADAGPDDARRTREVKSA